jgi:ATP-dependent Zn protease
VRENDGEPEQEAGVDLVQTVRSTEVHRGPSAVSASRERRRQRRLTQVAAVLAVGLAALLLADLLGHPITLASRPSFPIPTQYLPAFVLVALMGAVIVVPYLRMSASPHVLFRPEDLTTSLDDVVGASATKAEAIRTLNLLLARDTFEREMGGSVRRGLLFAGPPGTGKTYLAKAMAGSAGLPFLFATGTSFQSSMLGATQGKIRAYFREMRRVARLEGGVIAFIDEFDAIAVSRSTQEAVPGANYASAVNELLVQMQSFDTPSRGKRFENWCIERVNAWLPAARRIKRRPEAKPNLLLIAATNRAEALDPALLRPGRFDRVITFDLPVRRERADIAGYYLARKTHDVTVTPDEVAELTAGCSPVQIERLLDEALIVALQDGRRAMAWADVEEAHLTTLVGVARDGEYTASERWRIAVHESGHALAALLLGHEVGVVSILKRGAALGVTTHGQSHDHHLLTRSEALARVQIALGGLVAEELECNEPSSGAASDLASATDLAARVVGAYGMGSSLLSLDAATGMLGGNLVAKVLADEPSRKAAEALLDQSRTAVKTLLQDRRTILRRCAERLLADDEITGAELAKLLTNAVA